MIALLKARRTCHVECVLAMATFGLCVIPTVALCQAARDARPPKEPTEHNHLDMPAFPDVRYHDRVDIRIQSRFLPASKLGGAR